MLASSSKISLKRVHSHLWSATRRALEPSVTLRKFSSSPGLTLTHYSVAANHWQRRHTSTTTHEEFVPSPHLSASRQRLHGFTGDTAAQELSNGTTRARFAMQIMEAASKLNYGQALEIAVKMKTQNIKPDLKIYTALISAASTANRWLDAWAILDDMLAVGIQPDTTVLNALIRAQEPCSSDYLWIAVNKMDELGIAPNVITFRYIIRRLLDSNSPEIAVQFYHTLKARQIPAELGITASLVVHLAEAGYYKLAVDVLKDFESTSDRRFEHGVYYKCLIACAEAFDLDGVVFCWNKFVHELKLIPSEGVVLAVLDTAARNAHPDLAADALRVLDSLEVEFEEHHFAPLVEAFCREMKLKEAIQVLEIMRSKGILPRPETGSALQQALVDTETIDSVWSLADELLQENKHVDITVLQALISASVKLGDLQRAIGAYKSLSEYGATADIAIYKALLLGCLDASHKPLGQLLVNDMKATNIKMDQDVYDIWVRLCLTQPDYEDAFYYLEQMKSHGFHPTSRVYQDLVKKCLSVGDYRYKIAVQEMEKMGHQLGSLRRLIQRAERHDATPVEPQSVGIDGSALRFIETGGMEGVAKLPKEQT